MSLWRRIWVLAVLITPAAAMFVSLPAYGDPLRVGVIAPLSGSLAAMGASLRDGFVFWKERHPDSPIEFIFEDDQFQAKLAAFAAQKLITADGVAALVTVTSGPGMAVAPIAERHHVVHFCLTVDGRLAQGDYNFVHLFQSRDGARRLLEKTRAAGIRRIGIMRFIEDAAQLSAAELCKQAPAYGITVAYDEAFLGGTTDFRSFITAASQKGAEAVVVIALPPELETLAKQMRALHFAPRLTTIEIFNLSVEPHLFDGLWYSAPLAPDPEYAAAFSGRFHTPVGWGHYADNVATLLEAARSKAGKPADLARELMKLQNVPSTVGPLSSDADGIFAVPVVITVMENGVPKLLER